MKDVIKEMREHRTNHGQRTSPTLQAWADRLEAALAPVSKQAIDWLQERRDAVATQFPKSPWVPLMDELLAAVRPASPSAPVGELVSALQSMRDRMMTALPPKFGDAFDDDFDTLLEAINAFKAGRGQNLAALAKQPSVAPVGVEGLVATWRNKSERLRQPAWLQGLAALADRVEDLLTAWDDPGERDKRDAIAAELRALAQQPAAVDGAMWKFVADAFDNMTTSESERFLELLRLPDDHAWLQLHWHIQRALAAQPQGDKA